MAAAVAPLKKKKKKKKKKLKPSMRITLSVWGMFPHSEPDWKTPSGTFSQQFGNIHFTTTHTRIQTVITRHITYTLSLYL